MSRLTLLAAVLVAIAVPQTAIGQTSDSTPRCASAACKARLAKERKIHRLGYPFCNTWACIKRVRRKRERRVRRAMVAKIRPYVPWLRRVGDCENGPYGGAGLKEGLRAYNPSPFFGRYQFTMGTWFSVGGRGDPRDAPWYEQAYRAVLVLERDGPGAWPVCSR